MRNIFVLMLAASLLFVGGKTLPHSLLGAVSAWILAAALCLYGWAGLSAVMVAATGREPWWGLARAIAALLPSRAE